MVVATAFVSRSIPRARAAIDFCLSSSSFYGQNVRTAALYIRYIIFFLVRIIVMTRFINIVKLFSRFTVSFTYDY